MRQFVANFIHKRHLTKTGKQIEEKRREEQTTLCMTTNAAPYTKHLPLPVVGQLLADSRLEREHFAQVFAFSHTFLAVSTRES